MKFEIGDLVEIKSWEELEKEFGLDEDGDIPCTYNFVENMRELCGERFTIKELEPSIITRGVDEIIPDYETCNQDFDWFWNISADMIKKVE